jgi:hypothetical protein
MKIELINKKDYDFLKEMHEKHPNLTFQNSGYEYIDKSKLTPEDLIAIDNIEKLLKKHIYGFYEFNNFKLSKKNNELQIRFQYHWEAHELHQDFGFLGVGYISVNELLNGFKEKEK